MGARGDALSRLAVSAALAAIAACAIALAAPSGADQTAVSGPVRVVDRLHEAMLGVMRRSADLTYHERFELLAPAIDAAYDLDFMARKSLGRAFEGLDEPSRQRWLALFREYMVANYAGRFHGYAGQTFETLGEESAAQGTVQVSTKLREPGAAATVLNYRLRERDGAWRIVDVYLKGTVSELALRRADFAATIEREGFAALVASLEGKIGDLAAGKIK